MLVAGEELHPTANTTRVTDELPSHTRNEHARLVIEKRAERVVINDQFATAER
jgi:hypothetical protein